MRAPRLDHHGIHDQARDDRPVRVGTDHRFVHELLDDDDHPVCRERRLLLAAQQAPDLGVAAGRGALRVDDGHVRLQRRDGVDRLLAVRRLDRPDERIGDGQVGLEVAAQREERQVHGARRVAPDHAEVAVFLDLERFARELPFDPAADGTQPPDSWIAEPREHELRCHAAGDHLVVDEVRREARQREITFVLTDDLVAGRERDEVREALDCYGIAVAHEIGDRVAHGRDLGCPSHRASITDGGVAARRARPDRSTADNRPLRPRAGPLPGRRRPGPPPRAPRPGPRRPQRCAAPSSSRPR